MSYQIIPNLIFIVCVAGMIIIILRALPDAVTDAKKKEENIRVEEKLQEKGLPAIAYSKARAMLQVWGKKSLNFILEAKDVAPSGIAGYKIKKMFRGKQPTPTQSMRSLAKPENSNDDQKLETEEYYLAKIKDNPKNLQNYYELGRLYLSDAKFQDAADIFQYLSSYQPTNPEYHSREALCYFKLKQYEKAVDSYEKSVALDKTQPNRYYNLGVSAENAGFTEKAVAAFKQAIALEPANAKYYISLSSAQESLGLIEDAKETLQNAREADPNNLEVIENLKNLVK